MCKRARIPYQALCAMLLFSCGCAGFGRYMSDRFHDVLDIVDVKAGTGAVGIGVKVELTEYLGAGLAYSDYYDGVEWFGRRRENYSGGFAQYLVFGIDGDPIHGPVEGNTVFVGEPDPDRPAFSRYRVGGELVLPGANLGVYLNLAELVDALGGWFGWDPAGDDGLPRSSPFGDAKRADKEVEPRSEAKASKR